MIVGTKFRRRASEEELNESLKKKGQKIEKSKTSHEMTTEKEAKNCKKSSFWSNLFGSSSSTATGESPGPSGFGKLLSPKSKLKNKSQSPSPSAPPFTSSDTSLNDKNEIFDSTESINSINTLKSSKSFSFMSPKGYRKNGDKNIQIKGKRVPLQEPLEPVEIHKNDQIFEKELVVNSIGAIRPKRKVSTLTRLGIKIGLKSKYNLQSCESLNLAQNTDLEWTNSPLLDQKNDNPDKVDEIFKSDENCGTLTLARKKRKAPAVPPTAGSSKSLETRKTSKNFDQNSTKICQNSPKIVQNSNILQEIGLVGSANGQKSDQNCEKSLKIHAYSVRDESGAEKNPFLVENNSGKPPGNEEFLAKNLRNKKRMHLYDNDEARRWSTDGKNLANLSKIDDSDRNNPFLDDFDFDDKTGNLEKEKNDKRSLNSTQKQNQKPEVQIEPKNSCKNESKNKSSAVLQVQVAETITPNLAQNPTKINQNSLNFADNSPVVVVEPTKIDMKSSEKPNLTQKEANCSTVVTNLKLNSQKFAQIKGKDEEIQVKSGPNYSEEMRKSLEKDKEALAQLILLKEESDKSPFRQNTPKSSYFFPEKSDGIKSDSGEITVTPKPWYKRSSKSSSKKVQPIKPTISILPKFSDLDRETTKIMAEKKQKDKIRQALGLPEDFEEIPQPKTSQNCKEKSPVEHQELIQIFNNSFKRCPGGVVREVYDPKSSILNDKNDKSRDFNAETKSKSPISDDKNDKKVESKSKSPITYLSETDLKTIAQQYPISSTETSKNGEKSPENNKISGITGIAGISGNQAGVSCKNKENPTELAAKTELKNENQAEITSKFAGNDAKIEPKIEITSNIGGKSDLVSPKCENVYQNQAEVRKIDQNFGKNSNQNLNQDEMWTCPRCTLRNASWRLLCEACFLKKGANFPEILESISEGKPSTTSTGSTTGKTGQICENFLSQIPSKNESNCDKIGPKFSQNDPEIEEIDILKLRDARLAYFASVKNDSEIYSNVQNGQIDQKSGPRCQDTIYSNVNSGDQCHGGNFDQNNLSSSLSGEEFVQKMEKEINLNGPNNQNQNQNLYKPILESIIEANDLLYQELHLKSQNKSQNFQQPFIQMHTRAQDFDTNSNLNSNFPAGPADLQKEQGMENFGGFWGNFGQNFQENDGNYEEFRQQGAIPKSWGQNWSNQSCSPVRSPASTYFEPEYSTRSGGIGGVGCENTLAVNRLLKKLQGAINQGDHRLAASLAHDLALLKVNCIVAKNPKPTTIRVFVEDRFSQQGPFQVQLSSLITLKDLKLKIESDWGIPSSFQKWILNRNIAESEDQPLSEFNIEDDSMAFLYIVTPQIDVESSKKSSTLNLNERKVSNSHVKHNSLQNQARKSNLEKIKCDLNQDCSVESTFLKGRESSPGSSTRCKKNFVKKQRSLDSNYEELEDFKVEKSVKNVKKVEKGRRKVVKEEVLLKRLPLPEYIRNSDEQIVPNIEENCQKVDENGPKVDKVGPKYDQKFEKNDKFEKIGQILEQNRIGNEKTESNFGKNVPQNDKFEKNGQILDQNRIGNEKTEPNYSKNVPKNDKFEKNCQILEQNHIGNERSEPNFGLNREEIEVKIDLKNKIEIKSFKNSNEGNFDEETSKKSPEKEDRKFLPKSQIPVPVLQKFEKVEQNPQKGEKSPEKIVQNSKSGNSANTKTPENQSGQKFEQNLEKFNQNSPKFDQKVDKNGKTDQKLGQGRKFSNHDINEGVKLDQNVTKKESNNNINQNPPKSEQVGSKVDQNVKKSTPPPRPAQPKIKKMITKVDQGTETEGVLKPLVQTMSQIQEQLQSSCKASKSDEIFVQKDPIPGTSTSSTATTSNKGIETQIFSVQVVPEQNGGKVAELFTQLEKRQLKSPIDHLLLTDEKMLDKDVNGNEIKIQEIQETKVNDNYEEMLNLMENQDLVVNFENFECPICFGEIYPGQGVLLRDCLHNFCLECLNGSITHADEPEVKCPFRNETYSCESFIQEREIKAILPPEMFEKYLTRSVKLAENKMVNSYHCKTRDCVGWCVFEDDVNVFNCPVCSKSNCLTCQAIHEGKNCMEFQRELAIASETDADAKSSRMMMEEMIKRGEALECPACHVLLIKKWGCDFVKCSFCKTEICWITKGFRWGPGGKGDTSGGCKCGVNNIKCHPKCTYCH